ncbi:hypothetical protein CVT25_010207 [Psilocybe cyanescens]|uniref:Serine/threonine-protein kinase RIO2 n=1 Tax=Psilocybe cyanescens TaxID=93625 RepID=A0A409XD19_PSICY|nr:hypothetical protein CVT25_010207 [Psilocybe cyanescens]
MKLDATDLRYVTSDEFRVLTAVEMGSKNHEVVPLSLIVQISGLRNGGINKLVGSLAKRNLVSRVQNAKYDGYRLTYGGYDFLAMRALSKRDSMHSVGNQIGVGKESDIYIVADAEGNEMVLKLHRQVHIFFAESKFSICFFSLGRVSFRAIKEKRDYLGKRKSASWLYLSRLAAQKEWEFMKILHQHDFPVPRPIDQARHTILMEFIDAYPLRQVSEVENPGKLYSQLMDVIVRFAQAGLIHGDYNEFNILIKRDTGEPIVIDFPQMVSTSHENAEWHACTSIEIKSVEESGKGNFKLDVMVEASGFGRKEMKILAEYMEAVRQEEGDHESSGFDEEELDEEDGSESADEETEDAINLDEKRQNLDNGRPISNEAVEASSIPLHEASSSMPLSLSADPNTLKFDELEISDLSDTRLSRSPPQSRRNLPVEEDSSEEEEGTGQKGDIKSIVASDITKKRAQQQRKYHSKRSIRSAGRSQGSKAKQSTKVRLADHGGFWG